MELLLDKQEPNTLKDIYFRFYDNLLNESSDWAKENFDIEFAKQNRIPHTLNFALKSGFSWENTTQGVDYWEELSIKVFDLMDCYYELYNELSLEQRLNAYTNWEYKYALQFPAPKNLLEALRSGFI